MITQHVFEITTPWPVSENRLHRTGKHGKRYTSPEALAFKAKVAEIIRAMPPVAFVAKNVVRVETELAYYPPPGDRHDLDNMIKVVYDAIFPCIGVNDRRIKRQVAEMFDPSDPFDPGHVIVKLVLYEETKEVKPRATNRGRRAVHGVGDSGI